MDYTRLESFWPGWSIVGELGRGAYGRVYKAEHREFGQASIAAIKIIEVPSHPSDVVCLQEMGMGDDSIREYLQDMARGMTIEISLMQSLKDARNVVSVEDFHLEKRGDGVGWVMWVRMELLQSLPSYLRSLGMLPPPEEVARIGIPVDALVNSARRQRSQTRHRMTGMRRVAPRSISLEHRNSTRITDTAHSRD